MSHFFFHQNVSQTAQTRTVAHEFFYVSFVRIFFACLQYTDTTWKC